MKTRRSSPLSRWRTTPPSSLPPNGTSPNLVCPLPSSPAPGPFPLSILSSPLTFLFSLTHPLSPLLSAESFPAPLLLHTTHILSLALLLRAHLQSLYSLPDAKCRKFSFAAKKSAMGDRAAVRRDGVAVAFGVEGVPGLVRGGVESLGELEKVKEVFIGLVEGMGEIEGLGGGAGGKGDEDD